MWRSGMSETAATNTDLVVNSSSEASGASGIMPAQSGTQATSQSRNGLESGQLLPSECAQLATAGVAQTNGAAGATDAKQTASAARNIRAICQPANMWLLIASFSRKGPD